MMMALVKNSKHLIAFALLLVAIIGGGVWLVQSLFAAREIRNVILISIDTCRADYLSCYGYERPTTPNIDAVAAQGILFENVVTPVPITLPAHSSMLTGTIPPYHGVHRNIGYQLAESDLTLAEILGQNGFTTGAVISAFVLDSLFGIDQGFTTYNDKFEEAHLAAGASERKGGEATGFALEWLEEHKAEKFFFFLHYFDPHDEYVPPEPFASQFAGDPYAGEIAYTDYCIGQVMNKLKKLDLYDSTLIIITGDHGEMLGEHGEKTHSFFIYQSAIRVPLIFKLPGSGESRRISDLVGIIDIVPTICGMLGIEVPGAVQGQDLSAYLGDKQPSSVDRYMYCESQEPTDYDANPLLGVLSSRFKYIQTIRPELYDFIEDSAEADNLVEKQPQRARVMKDILAQILEQSVRKGFTDSKLELDAEALSRLGSLGYVGGGTNDEDFEFDQSKADPKDLIDFVQWYRDGWAFYQKKQYDQAIRHYDKAVELNPTFAKTYNKRGIVLAKKRDYDRAIADFDKAIKLDPALANAYKNRGMAHVIKEHYDQAIRDFDRAIELNPSDALVHKNMAQALVQTGKSRQAVRHYRTALELHSDWPEVLNALAWILATHQDLRIRDGTQAVQLAERACELTEYKTAEVLDTLAAAYAETGRFDQAVDTVQKALELAQAAGQDDLAEEFQQHLELFESAQPYRDTQP